MDDRSWSDSESFFLEFIDEPDNRGQLAMINLTLMERLRQRWHSAMECHSIMGFGMVISPRGAPYSEWVRIEPKIRDPEPLVSVSLRSNGPMRSGLATNGLVVAGTVCRVPTAETVIESYLIQLGGPSSV
jgi:hypothetical protein